MLAKIILTLTVRETTKGLEMGMELRVIKSLPPAQRQKRKSEYADILKQFLQSKAEYAEIVTKTDVKGMSVATGLRNVIKRNKELDCIVVKTRKSDKDLKVYLVLKNK